MPWNNVWIYTNHVSVEALSGDIHHIFLWDEHTYIDWHYEKQKKT